ncbi:MAG: lysophospholipid acyltransferase family protein [Acidobacteriota bacterium]
MNSRESASPGYDHSKHERRRRALRWLLANVGWPLFARIDLIEHADRVPDIGPAILISNHIAFVDPIVVLGHVRRNVIPIAKIESSRVPFWGMFVGMWDVIDVRRDGSDHDAVARALAVLEAGEIVLLSPEATRSPALRQARDGVAYLAYRSGAPVVPIAVEGTEGFPTINPRRRMRPGAVVRFGYPLRLKPIEGRPTRDQLRAITDEAMGRIAVMLPDHRRGVYREHADRPLVYFEEDRRGE